MRISSKVVVSCVVFETYKIVQPIEHLKGAGKVYLIHWISKRNPEGGSIYRDFYSRNVEMLSKVIDPTSIIEVIAEVYDFKKMLATILSILREERARGNEVFINISSGTSEYAAAATIASMMVPGVRPFSVRTGNGRYPGRSASGRFTMRTGCRLGSPGPSTILRTCPSSTSPCPSSDWWRACAYWIPRSRVRRAPPTRA
jgi:hypothetical protein